MATELLATGMPWTLVQNRVYALPAKLCQVSVSGACDTSLNGTTWIPFSTGGTTADKYIRSTVVGTIAICKPAETGGFGGTTIPTADIGKVFVSDGVDRPARFDSYLLISQIEAESVASVSIDATDSISAPTLSANNSLSLGAVPFGTVLGASPGALANFNNSTVNTIGATIAGGGSFNVLGRFNGTIWKVAAA